MRNDWQMDSLAHMYKMDYWNHFHFFIVSVRKDQPGWSQE